MLSGCPKTSVRPQEQRYPVTFAVDGTHGTLEAKIGSTVLKNKDSAPLGATVVFTAKPEAGYKVKAWTLDGNPVNGTAETYPLKITKVVTVTVSFESSAPVPPPPPPAPRPIPKFKVTFSVDGGNGILTAKLDGKEITTGTEVEKDKTVTFTANPAAANILVNTWTVSPSAALIEGGAKGNTAAKVKITAETTVTVRFEAVPDGSAVYRVEHYKQNVTGADYTKAEEESTTGKPNAQTQAQAKAYEGFNAKLPITQSAIKADGSTVIKVYYDRKTITLTLNLDGGSTSTPLTSGKLTGRFGAAVNVAAPTKPGYTFKGWNPVLPTSFPVNDGTHTAQWAKESDYTITYNLNGGTDNGGNPVSYNEKTPTITLKSAVRAGYTFAGWYAASSLTGTPVTKIETGSTGNKAFWAKWQAKTDTPYKVEHWQQNAANDEYTLAETEPKTGTTEAQTQAQAKVYEGFNAKLPITQSAIKAYGSTVIKVYYDRKTITLTLNLDGGSTSTPLTGGKLTGRFGAAVSVAAPTKPNHIFKGWNPALPAAFPSENPAETYTAQWEVLSYAVTFSVEGNPENGTLSAELDGNLITSPAQVEKDKTVTFTAKPANANVLVKKWTVTPPSALTEGGTDGSLTAKVKITAATTVSLSFDAPPPGFALYKVEHWKQNVAGTDYEKAETEITTGSAGAQTEAQAKTYPGFTLKDSVTQVPIAGEGTTVVKIEYDRKEISLSLNLDGGSTSTPLTGGKLTGRFGTAVTIAEPTRPDHIFDGWNPALPPTFPAEDPAETYTAKWKPIPVINFGVQGSPANGSLSAKVDENPISSGDKVEEGKTVIFTAVPDPQFAVEQWTVNGNPVPDNTTNTYSHTVTAQADIRVKFKYAGPDLVLDTKDFTKEQGQNFTYTLVTSGSGDYTATPENAAFISVTLTNDTGNVTVRCLAEGSSRIKVKDNKSGEEAYSGTITVKPLVTIPNDFTVDGIYYKVTDKDQRHVQIAGKDGGYFTGTVHIPATAAFNGETYQITGFTDSCLNRDIRNVSAFTVDGANAFLCAENGVLFNKDKTRLIKYPSQKTDASYTVPDSVQTIGKYAFYKVKLTALTLPEGKALSVIEDHGIESCTQLENINLPSSLTSLGAAFLFDSKVTSVVIPEGIERLGHASLAWCPKLTKVEFPASFKSSAAILYRCDALTEVVCKAATPPNLYESLDQGTPIASCTLKVPAGSVSAYEADPVWKNFKKPFETITP